MNKGGSRLKLAEEVAMDIERWVMDQGWPVGSNLGSEQDLINRFGVSRSAFREAIRIVEHHGVAVMRRGAGGGLIVTEPEAHAVERAAALYLDWADVSTEDLFITRSSLELTCVNIVANSIDEAMIHRLREHVAQEAQDGWDALHVGSLHDLHVLIAELTGNPAMRLFVETLARLTVDRAQVERMAPRLFDEIHSAHLRIIEALNAGDAALAQERMRKHLRASVQGARSYPRRMPSASASRNGG
jgi:DNA-binding FadR family transcriptional regulator